MKKTLLIIPALLVLMLVWAAPAHSTGPAGEWHTWEVQGDYGPDWDQNYAEAFAQPQVHVGEGQIAPQCETWVQRDFYPYAAQKHGKTIAEVIEDGLLHDGEDHHLTGHKDGKWEFVYGGDCPPVKPEPKSGTESGTYDYCTVPADGTRTHVMTETAWTQDWAWSQEEGEWVLGDKVYGEPGESGLLTQDVECAAPETPVTTEQEDEEPVTPPEQEDVAPPATPVEAEATFTG